MEKQEILEDFHEFDISYLSKKKFPTIIENVFLPRLCNPINPLHWKNNNSESVNNKIKLIGERKTYKLLVNLHNNSSRNAHFHVTFAELVRKDLPRTRLRYFYKLWREKIS